MKVESMLLLDAMHEIKMLRQQNAIHEARLETMEIFAAALGMKKPNQGYSHPDIVHRLQTTIDRIESDKER